MRICSFLMTDVCSVRPCFAADLCSVVGGVCECKEGYRFDDDLNCVGMLFLILNNLSYQNDNH